MIYLFECTTALRIYVTVVSSVQAVICIYINSSGEGGYSIPHSLTAPRTDVIKIFSAVSAVSA